VTEIAKPFTTRDKTTNATFPVKRANISAEMKAAMYDIDISVRLFITFDSDPVAIAHMNALPIQADMRMFAWETAKLLSLNKMFPKFKITA
jgi:hypothetical protein